MVYDIEFIRRVEGKAGALAVHVVQVVADRLAPVIARANETLHGIDTVPRPSGFRIRDIDGAILHEFDEGQPA